MIFNGEHKIDVIHGEKIIYKNFSGKPGAYNNEGDRNFCLVVTNPKLKGILTNSGYNIKKGNSLRPVNYDLDTFEFIKIKIPKCHFGIRGPGDLDKETLFKLLDSGTIKSAFITIELFTMDLDTSKGVRHVTTIYLKEGTFYLNDGAIIEMGKNIKTEEIKMVKTTENYMSMEETIGMLGLAKMAFDLDSEALNKNEETKKLYLAIRSAYHYLFDTFKNNEKPCEIAENHYTKPTQKVIGDFAAIKQVMFNDPATVVVWWDDVKTVVKCQKGDTFDKEKGLAMAICKRLYGNESNFNNMIKKWTEPKVKKVEEKTENKPNKARNGCRGKDIAPRKNKTSTELKSTSKMIVVTEEYIRCVRVKMAKRGWNYEQTADAAGIGKSTLNRYISTKEIKSRPSRMTRSVFEKINKALGIRWRM